MESDNNLTMEEGIPDFHFQYTYFPIAINTFLFFGVLALVVNPFLLWYFFRETYQTLTPFQKCDWNSQILSSCHAFLVSGLGLYNTLFDKPTWDDPLWGDSYLPRVTVAITTGYITCDLLFMLIGFPIKESLNYILHHLAVNFAYTANLCYGPLTYFANLRVLAEMSTPFVNLRWTLHLLGYKESQLYLYNGFAMLGAFFVFRVAIIPFFYYKLLTTLYSQYKRLPVWMWFVCSVSCIALDVLNAIWFRKMFRGAYKMLKKRAEASDKTRTRIKGE